MHTEIEAKFTDINPEKLRVKLKESGAKMIYPEQLMKRRVFDFKDKNLEEQGAWMRVRDEGDKVTMSFKRLIDRTLHGTKEVTIEVDDFHQACNLINCMGLVDKAYQETKREKWILDGVEITIDTWPWIPTFAELEADSKERLKEAAAKLDFDWGKAMHGSVETVYQQHYDVTEQEIDNWDSITFIPIPDWLEKKRRK